MKLSNYLFNSLKEEPKEAELISHKLLLRGNFIKKLSSGIYTYMPLGYRVIKKIENIIREELDKAGAIEVLLPVLQPKEIWEETNRFELYGDDMFKVIDRHKKIFGLAPTAEEVITDLVRKEVKSYRDLPLNLYQIGIKFRDEIRPRFGIMRAREFIMKDGYSFDATMEEAQNTYKKMYEAYTRILDRLKLNYKSVEASTGEIGGNLSDEFMVIADSGEDTIVICSNCDYRANMELAVSIVEDQPVNEDISLEKVYTPDIYTVSDVANFFKTSPDYLIKTLIVIADEKPLALLIRGDDELCESKVKTNLKISKLRFANEEEIEALNSYLGFSGPVGLKNIKIIADKNIKENISYITGANEKNYHFKGVKLNRDFKVDEFNDLRKVKQGEKCIKCNSKLELKKGIEVGHIFLLGTKYSKDMNATYIDRDGKQQYIIMGCYGIGVGRLAAAIVEQNYDEDGMIFPVSVAPFEVVILPVNVNNTQHINISNMLYEKLLENKIDVLLDDRNIRPGSKFKDLDLIGIPYRITVGKLIKDGKVEIYNRRTKEKEEIEIEKVIDRIINIIKSER